MNTTELKEELKYYKLCCGGSYAYIARRCGVSREHISRWVHNDNYKISESLQKRLYKFLYRSR